MNEQLARANKSTLRHLPNGKSISSLGFGCSSIWAKPDFPDDAAMAILRGVHEEGINHFDTSPSYGDGLGEERLGRFLKDRDLSRTVVTTKVGTNLIDGRIERGFDRDLMERSFTGSLTRLGVAHVDILYLHGPSINDLADNSSVFSFFDAQKAAGRITYSGVNTFDPATLDRAARTPIDCAMLQYNVGDFRNARQIETFCDSGKFVISGTVLSRAKFDLAAFFPRSRQSFWYLLRMLRNEPGFLWSGYQLGKRLRETGMDPVTAAIQFATGHPGILSHMFGTSNLAHAKANARAGRGALDPALRRRLDRSAF